MCRIKLMALYVMAWFFCPYLCWLFFSCKSLVPVVTLYLRYYTSIVVQYLQNILKITCFRYSAPAGEILAEASTGRDPPPSASSPISTWLTSPAQDPTLWVKVFFDPVFSNSIQNLCFKVWPFFHCRFSLSPHFTRLCPEKWGLSENIQCKRTH